MKFYAKMNGSIDVVQFCLFHFGGKLLSRPGKRKYKDFQKHSTKKIISTPI